MSRKLYSDSNRILSSFSDMLDEIGASKVTIKNYLSDVRAFVVWRSRSKHYLSDREIVNVYLEDVSSKFSASSLKRKRSAIKKYLTYESRIAHRNYDKRNFAILYSPLVVFVTLIVAYILLVSSGRSNTSIKDLQEDAVVNVSNIGAINKVPTTGLATKSEGVYSFKGSQGVAIVLPKESTQTGSSKDVLFLNELKTPSDIEQVQAITKDHFLSQGVSTIYSGSTETVMVSDLISLNSFIDLVPMGPSDNQILYIKELGEGYAVISVEKPLEFNLDFSWQINNTEVYHSIL